MNKTKAYFKESYDELVLKTTWPTLPELQKSAAIVAFASVIIALIIFGMDKAISGVLKVIYGLF
jgi:preprotein translocase subunit SecE